MAKHYNRNLCVRTISKIPQKSSVYWSYCNPKNGLNVMPWVPQQQKPHIVVLGCTLLIATMDQTGTKLTNGNVLRSTSEKDLDHQ